MKKWYAFPAAATAVVLLSVAAGQQGRTGQGQGQRGQGVGQQQGTSQSRVDQHFLKEAIQGNLFEIEASEAIIDKVRDPEVKQFAQMMVRDHTRALEQLRQLAQQVNMDDVPDEMADWQQSLMEHMEELEGEDLERAYVFHQVGMHHTKLLSHMHAANEANERQVQQLARQMGQTIQTHLQHAEQIAQRLANGQEAGGRGAGDMDRDRGRGTGAGGTDSGRGTGGSGSGGTGQSPRNR